MTSMTPTKRGASGPRSFFKVSSSTTRRQSELTTIWMLGNGLSSSSRIGTPEKRSGWGTNSPYRLMAWISTECSGPSKSRNRVGAGFFRSALVGVTMEARYQSVPSVGFGCSCRLVVRVSRGCYDTVATEEGLCTNRICLSARLWLREQNSAQNQEQNCANQRNLNAMLFGLPLTLHNIHYA